MAVKLYDAYGREIRRTAGFSSAWQYEPFSDSKSENDACDCVGFWHDTEMIESEDYYDNKEKKE